MYSEIITHIVLFVALFVEVFLLLTFLENKRRVRGKKQNLTLCYFPSFTIMVPVWNEEKTVSKTLGSLLKLNYPKNKVKIFVINDGSSDNTAKVLSNYENNKQIRIFHKENGGKYTALNLGLKHARSELVGCLDADSYVKADSLIHIAKAFEDKRVMSVVPSIKVHEPKTILQKLQAAEYMLSVFMRFSFCALGSQYITPGPFSFFRREVFEKLGPYKHAHNTEDMEIALRMQEARMKIVNAHDAHVLTTSPSTFRKLYKQRVRWYHGGFQNLIDYKHLFFRKDLGTLGYFILPAATFSIFSVFYILTSFLIYTSQKIVEKITYLNAVNWNFNLEIPMISLFDISFSTIEIIAILGFFAVVIAMLSGKFISQEKVKINEDMFWYFLLYGIIMPLWFIKPLYNTVLSRKTAWR